MKPLEVKKNPCSTCPYRKDTPSGLWAEDEYEKLRGYDDNTAFSTFLCHQTNVTDVPTACKGWLMVHCDSVAVRLAQLKGEVKAPECFEEPDVELYASGNEAADAGEREIKRPKAKSRRIARKMLATGRFKEG